MNSNDFKKIANVMWGRYKVFGKSVAYNQSCNISAVGGTYSNVSISVTNNRLNFVGTADGTSYRGIGIVAQRYNGHKYAIIIDGDTTGLKFNVVYGGGDATSSKIVTATGDDNRITVQMTSGTTYNTSVQIQQIDLTLLGLDSITTIAQFNQTDLGKAIASGTYLPYSATNTTLTTTSPLTYSGRNLCNNSTIRDGWISGSNGAFVEEEGGSKATDYIEVDSNKLYSFACGNSISESFITEYDENKTFIKQTWGGVSSYINFQALDSNTKYIVISYKTSPYVANATCLVQLSSETQTSYVPYNKPFTLGLLKSYTFTGNETWDNVDGANRFKCDVISTIVKKPATNTDLPNVSFLDYSVGNWVNYASRSFDKLIAISYTTGFIAIYDTSITTTQQMQQLTAGKTIYFEPSTPITLNQNDYYINTTGKLERKMGVVDLGSLEWVYNVNGYFNVARAGVKELGTGFCSKYPVITGSVSSNDKVIKLLRDLIIVKDTDYGNDVATFKQAMSGVVLYYELATPTTEMINSAMIRSGVTKVTDANGVEVEFE